MHRKSLRQSKGFTLIEMIMVVVILSIISVALGQVLFEAFENFRTAQSIGDSSWQGFLALNRLTTDVHSIMSAGSVTGVGASSFTYIDTSNATVTYTISGGGLYRNGVLLASGIQSGSFSYFDGNGNSTATASAVRYVRLALNIVQGNIPTFMYTTAGTRGGPA